MRGDLWVVRPDGTGNTAVSAVQANGDVFDYAWAPDSSRLAYRADQITEFGLQALLILE